MRRFVRAIKTRATILALSMSAKPVAFYPRSACSSWWRRHPAVERRPSGIFSHSTRILEIWLDGRPIFWLSVSTVSRLRDKWARQLDGAAAAIAS
jgi:hypothetical protein